MEKINLHGLPTSADRVREFISSLYNDKIYNLTPKYIKSINSGYDHYGKGIYFYSHGMAHGFAGVFTTNDLFPNLTLKDDLYDEIGVIRKIELPSWDTPNGFSDIEKESFKRMHPPYIEASDNFNFIIKSKISLLEIMHKGKEKGSPNFVFKELSTKVENFVTFQSLIEKEAYKKLTSSFEFLAKFYYYLNQKHPNSLHLGMHA